MRDPNQAQSILSDGSLTGFHPLVDLGGHSYLSAETTRGQPLCGDKHGWGPLWPGRYDFTPCFMDVWVSSVAVYGILFGAVAIWWLVRRKTKAEVQKDWHFWTKQVCRLRNSIQSYALNGK
jgi:ATP-binding cassette subfamily C (CFTR/MRP) protein 1